MADPEVVQGRSKRRASELDKEEDGSEIPAVTDEAPKQGVLKIPRSNPKRAENSTDAQPSGSLFGDLTATSGNGPSLSALLGAQTNTFGFSNGSHESEDDEEAVHSSKRQRPPAEFDFEAAARQKEEDRKAAEEEQKSKTLESTEEEQKSKTLESTEDAKSKSEEEPKTSIFGSASNGPFCFGIGEGGSIFGSLPTIKPLNPSPTEEPPEPAASATEDISVDAKSSRPTSFPGEENEEVLFEEFDSSLAVVVKNEAGGWAMKRIGAGAVRVLKDKSDGSVRCVFRVRGVWKLELNSPKEMFKFLDSPKALVAKFMAYDMHKEDEAPEKRRSVFTLSFPSVERKSTFLSTLA